MACGQDCSSPAYPIFFLHSSLSTELQFCLVYPAKNVKQTETPKHCGWRFNMIHQLPNDLFIFCLCALGLGQMTQFGPKKYDLVKWVLSWYGCYLFLFPTSTFSLNELWLWCLDGQQLSCNHEQKSYWAGQQVCLGFSITSYRKTQTNLLANPIHAKGSREGRTEKLGDWNSIDCSSTPRSSCMRQVAVTISWVTMIIIQTSWYMAP